MANDSQKPFDNLLRRKIWHCSGAVLPSRSRCRLRKRISEPVIALLDHEMSAGELMEAFHYCGHF